MYYKLNSSVFFIRACTEIPVKIDIRLLSSEFSRRKHDPMLLLIIRPSSRILFLLKTSMLLT